MFRSSALRNVMKAGFLGRPAPKAQGGGGSGGPAAEPPATPIASRINAAGRAATDGAGASPASEVPGGPAPEDPPFALREFPPPLGRALVAARPIRAGEVILREAPLLFAGRPAYVKTGSRLVMDRSEIVGWMLNALFELQRLPLSDQARVLDMFCPPEPEFDVSGGRADPDRDDAPERGYDELVAAARRSGEHGSPLALVQLIGNAHFFEYYCARCAAERSERRPRRLGA